MIARSKWNSDLNIRHQCTVIRLHNKRFNSNILPSLVGSSTSWFRPLFVHRSKNSVLLLSWLEVILLQSIFGRLKITYCYQQVLM